MVLLEWGLLWQILAQVTQNKNEARQAANQPSLKNHFYSIYFINKN